MDYKQFLSLVSEELDYLQAFSLECEHDLMKAAGALVTLKEYIETKLIELNGCHGKISIIRQSSTNY